MATIPFLPTAYQLSMVQYSQSCLRNTLLLGPFRPRKPKTIPSHPSLLPLSSCLLLPSLLFIPYISLLHITLFSNRTTIIPPSTQLFTPSFFPPSTHSSPVQKPKPELVVLIFWAHFVDLALILLQKDC